ncbi:MULTISPECIES: YfjP family GTPase [unclassified Nonomuraea]|uniref:YfjP family GTPase n=1 Tax=unclassified Nonomuraea TaxID=2593643 RepID=UPI0033CCA32D
MKLLRRKEGPPLDSRLDALLEAATLAGGRLPDGVVGSARAVAERAGVRRSLSAEHTVVALAGATGSGKSSLFNALTGTEVAAVGVTRPTTSAVQAAVWDGDTGAGPLLDWLDVFTRHQAADAHDVTGLILLDLPDHDSIQLGHRLEVDRLVELVDLLVWVLDPQKYADAALHERYLRPLSGHRDVMVVALNQADRLPPDAVDRCLRDVRRLLDDDGLKGVPVLATSARTGMGLPELRALLAGRVADRRAWASRLAADVTTAADLLAAASGSSSGAPPEESAAGETGEPDHPTAASPGAGAAGAGVGVLAAGREIVRSAELPEAVPAGDVTARLGRRLTVALEEAAGVPTVLEAVAKGHRHRAVVATGWPVTRWIRRLRPDPLRRLRLGTSTGAGSGASTGVSTGTRDGTRDGIESRTRSGAGGGATIAARDGASEVERPAPRGESQEIVGRTSLPAASAVQRARVETAIRDVGDTAAAGVPGPWAAAVRRAARAHSGELTDAVDRAVGRTSVRATRQPRWWKAVGVVQWLVFAAMVAGALWLGALFGLDYLRLPELPVPTLGVVPWPTVLLVGGALAGILVALLSRLAAWAGGRRRARRTARALRAAIGEVGAAYVLQPVEAELDAYTRFRAAVERARARS